MEDENILARVGTFFLVIGSGLIFMFIASDLADDVSYDLFFIGAFLSGIGIFMRRKAPPPPQSGRFESWKKWRSGQLKEEQSSKRAKRKTDKKARNAAKKGGE